MVERFLAAEQTRDRLRKAHAEALDAYYKSEGHLRTKTLITSERIEQMYFMEVGYDGELRPVWDGPRVVYSTEQVRNSKYREAPSDPNLDLAADEMESAREALSGFVEPIANAAREQVNKRRDATMAASAIFAAKAKSQSDRARSETREKIAAHETVEAVPGLRI